MSSAPVASTFHLYVYYEVPSGAVPAVVERVRALQQRMAAPRSRLQRSADVAATAARVDGVPGAPPETWMETYEDVDAHFAARLDAAVAADGLLATTGPRHVERFVDVP